MHRALLFSVAIVVSGTLILDQAVSQTTPDSDFESLSACSKLDAIDRAGKSVPDYIAGSGYRQFDDEIRSTCPWHSESLNVALTRLGRDPAFEALSACDKLRAVDRAGKSLPQYIADSGIEDFDTEIINNCPRYRTALEEAGGPGRGEGPGANLDLQGSTEADFDRLSACEKLDAIAKAGKSVPDYIAGSGYRQFDNEIRSTCDWHLESLNVALNSLGREPAFEMLTACQKLDAIDEAGKSVPQYIAGSGLEEFSADVYSMCRRHVEALTEAQRIAGESGV
ncbi:MAG: hypothetical protein AAF722_10385 [Cyanobacteria bacterium P01_C01_bin.70]